MKKKVSKAADIRSYLKNGKYSVGKIAAILKVSPSYVYSVKSEMAKKEFKHEPMVATFQVDKDHVPDYLKKEEGTGFVPTPATPLTDKPLSAILEDLDKEIALLNFIRSYLTQEE